MKTISKKIGLIIIVLLGTNKFCNAQLLSAAQQSATLQIREMYKQKATRTTYNLVSVTNKKFNNTGAIVSFDSLRNNLNYNCIVDSVSMYNINNNATATINTITKYTFADNYVSQTNYIYNAASVLIKQTTIESFFNTYGIEDSIRFYEGIGSNATIIAKLQNNFVAGTGNILSSNYYLPSSINIGSFWLQSQANYFYSIYQKVLDITTVVKPTELDPAFINSVNQTFVYDLNTMATYYKFWNTTNNNWENDGYDKDYYNADGTLEYKVTYNWQTSNFQLIDSAIFKNYHAQNYDSIMVYDNVNTMVNMQYNEYDFNGNIIKTINAENNNGTMYTVNEIVNYYDVCKPLGINENSLNTSSYFISPNPAINNFVITANTNEPIAVKIIATNGAVVYNANLYTNTSINANLSSGLYFVTVTNNQGLIKQLKLKIQ
jgi:hypothetical protein